MIQSKHQYSSLHNSPNFKRVDNDCNPVSYASAEEQLHDGVPHMLPRTQRFRGILFYYSISASGISPGRYQFPFLFLHNCTSCRWLKGPASGLGLHANCCLPLVTGLLYPVGRNNLPRAWLGCVGGY